MGENHFPLITDLTLGLVIWSLWLNRSMVIIRYWWVRLSNTKGNSSWYLSERKRKSSTGILNSAAAVGDFKITTTTLKRVATFPFPYKYVLQGQLSLQEGTVGLAPLAEWWCVQFVHLTWSPGTRKSLELPHCVWSEELLCALCITLVP